MNLTTWWHRHFTAAGRDAAWRERYERCHGEAYSGHVPPRPMPAPAPSVRPVGPISLEERAARFRRGMEVVHSLSPECLRLLQEDGRILAEVASRAQPAPPRHPVKGVANVNPRPTYAPPPAPPSPPVSRQPLAWLVGGAEAPGGSMHRAAPARPKHHGMFIVADETIAAGQAIHLDACADGSYAARVRRFDRA